MCPKSISAITFCPSMMIGASLDYPTRWVIGSRFRKGTAGVTSHLPLCLAAFIFAGLGLGSGWTCGGIIVALVSCYQLGSGPHFLSSTWAGLKQMLVYDTLWPCGPIPGICSHVPGHYSGCCYHYCLIWSVSGQPLTWQSGAAAWPFPPQWPLQPSSLSSSRSPQFWSPPSRQLS